MPPTGTEWLGVTVFVAPDGVLVMAAEFLRLVQSASLGKGAWASADRRTLDQGGRLLQKLKARFVIAERDILLYSGRFGCSCRAPGKQGF